MNAVVHRRPDLRKFSKKINTPQRAEVFQKGRDWKVYYCVRTHTQVAQMAKVIKGLPYTPTMATLGSR